MDVRHLLSDKVLNLKPSGIRKFFDLASEMKGNVISLSIGEPDFTSPDSVLDAARKAIDDGETHYTSNQGDFQLRKAVSEYLAERFDAHYDPANEIVITVGASELIDGALRALLNPGDEVVVAEPCFVSYQACAEMAGGKVISLPLRAEDNFKLTPEVLRPALSEKTKALMVSFPSNPTGAVMEKEDWAKLLPILLDFPNLVTISDDIYVELTYPPAKPASLASFPEIRDRLILVSGMSKAFAMTGWRLGYGCAVPEILEQINKIHQYVIMSAPTISQKAAYGGYKAGLEATFKMRDAYNERRKLLYNSLKDMGIEVFEPLGAFYMFPYIGNFGLSSYEFCERLLSEKKLAMVPGNAFGDCGEGYVRISYAASTENIREAMRRLKEFITEDLARK